VGLTEPNPKSFVDHLNVFDCSKVSDGAAGIAVMSEEGL
jgi:acetyl-CoA C-acetyltransferase/acetyl-CoA acyltransferase